MELYNNCINCGKKNEELTKFCVECGTSLINESTVPPTTILSEKDGIHNNQGLQNDLHMENPTNPILSEQENIPTAAVAKRPTQVPAKKSRKKLIAALISAGIIIGGGAGAYVYLNGEEDTNITAQLSDAAKEKDYKAFLKLIELDGIDFYEEDVYIEYLKSFGLKDIVDELNDEISSMDKDTKDAEVKVDGVVLFNVEKDHKTKEITVYPNALTVDAVTEVVGLQLSLAGEKLIFKKDSLSIGTILPGTYKAKLTGEMDGFKVDETIELTFDDTVSEIQIKPTTFALDYKSNYENTAISIDGKITEQIGNEHLIFEIPVGNEVEVYGIVEYDGKEYESEREKVSDTTTVQFKFPELDQIMAKQDETDTQSTELPENFPTGSVEQEITVLSLANEIIPSFLNVYVNGDIDALSDYVYDKTPFYTSHLNVMKKNAENGTTIELLLVTVDSVEIIEENKFIVTTSEEFKVTTPGKETKTPSQETKYTVQFVDGQLYITDLSL